MSLPKIPGAENGIRRDPDPGVVVVLLALSVLGAAVATVGGWWLANAVLLDVAVTLGNLDRLLVGVVVAQSARMGTPSVHDLMPLGSIGQPISLPTFDSQNTTTETTAARGRPVLVQVWNWCRGFGEARSLRTRTAVAGLMAVVFIPLLDLQTIEPGLEIAFFGAVLALTAAALAATAARYLADIDVAQLPEGPGLCRGTRLVTWIFVLAALSILLQWAVLPAAIRILHVGLLTLIVAVCYALWTEKPQGDGLDEIYRLDLGVLGLFGSRVNLLASVLDTAQRQLGIDLRSTWALTVVRRSLEPLLFGLFVIGWLSTSLTVVGISEQGLVERLGVPVAGAPLEPGLRLHWPWPVDRVFRIPVRRVQSISVGHEGEEAGGPENVLWAVEHAANEYTLLLGNGRDLITIDAAVQFRITDAYAWQYHSQNPGDALKAIAYRAVMRSTVNHTLAEALSENVVTTTAQMRAMVQQDADALGLGVRVVGFTVGGMHPPVTVAADYEAVVSAALGKVTAVVNAQAERNRTVPVAQSSVLVGSNTARAQGAQDLALAAGEAWSFRTLESQYRVAPEDYFFRRRLETLERGLLGKPFTVVDSRFERDGGVLWVNP